MRVAIISDIHSNLPALTSTLNAIDALGVDGILCLGDIVGYGPFPNECVELVRSRCLEVVKGNHDCGVTNETPISAFNEHGKDAIRWTQGHITNENLEYIRSLNLISQFDSCTIVHASPSNPGFWTYVVTWQEAHECFESFSTELCFIGHTHVPIVIGEDSIIGSFRKGVRSLINVGSVGQPRDGNPKASFGFLDTDEWTYGAIRVEYEVEKTAQQIRKVGLPSYLAKRLAKGI